MTKMTNYINMECVIPVAEMYLQYPTRSFRMFGFGDVWDGLRVFEDYI